VTLTLAVTAGVLYAAGTYLLLQRTLTRIVIGLAMMGHGANVLLLMAGGGPGAAPFIGDGPPPAPYTDPLPQALALTAIVITFGVIAFLLALALRSRALTGNDVVEDEIEDRRLIREGRLPEVDPGPAEREGGR
jgi:multicomponent Na+:H+ antiporter subunit C